ncbi:MAG: hypothetical protein CMO55_07005 [Verrucomicrobiales bacterium]|nr:hypothetical protein [Verrucomicrobiales bacterium]
MEAPWFSMIFASLLVAVVAVLAFKWAYRPHSALVKRNRMVARLIEMFLYQESLRASGRAAGRLMKALGAYLVALLLPLFAAMAPAVLILVLVEPMLAWSPFSAGQDFLVETESPETVEWQEAEGLQLTAPPFRFSDSGRTVWRFQGEKEGIFELTFGEGKEHSTLEVVIGTRTWILKPGWTTSAAGLLPGVGAIREGQAISRCLVEYPEQLYRISGWNCGWLTALSVISFLLAIPAAIIFKIRL